jgi:hypothetical protein
LFRVDKSKRRVEVLEHLAIDQRRLPELPSAGHAHSEESPDLNGVDVLAEVYDEGSAQEGLVIDMEDPGFDLVTVFDCDFEEPDLADVETYSSTKTTEGRRALMVVVYNALKAEGGALEKPKLLRYVKDSVLGRFLQGREEMVLGQWLSAQEKASKPLLRTDRLQLLGITNFGLDFLKSGELPDGFERVKRSKKPKALSADAALDERIAHQLQVVQAAESEYRSACSVLAELMVQQEEQLDADAARLEDEAEQKRERAGKISKFVLAARKGQLPSLEQLT